MSHSHPPSDSAGYAGAQPTGPAYSPPYLGTYTPPSEQRAKWPLLLVALVLMTSLAAVLVKATFHASPDLPPPSGSSLPPAPPMVVPQGSVTFSGTGWIMEVSPHWDKLRGPAPVKVDVAWATGGGVRGFASNLSVQSETQPETMTVQAYTSAFATQLPILHPRVHVVSQQAYEAPGREYGRVVYTSTGKRFDIQSVAYVTRTADAFAIATYTSPQQLFTRSAEKVEPYLASLKAH